MKVGSLSLAIVLATTAIARAQPTPTQAQKADATTCTTLDLTPGALLQPTVVPTGQLSLPIPWTTFVVDGDLVDSAATVHGLLEPAMDQTLSDAKWPEIAERAARYGYQLVGHDVQGDVITLHLAPLPMVRKVYVEIPWWSLKRLFSKLLDDEIKRRMRVRVGTYLPWETIRRQCALLEERDRIVEFLHDEGYFEATVEIVPTTDGASIKLRVDVDLGAEYTMGKVTLAAQQSAEPLAISAADIKNRFRHKDRCLGPACLSRARFTRTQHQEDLQALKDRFHKLGYPAARIQSSFDAKTSFDRHTKTVNVTITIDQRRKLDVDIIGYDHDAITPDELRSELTFDDAGSLDDVEATASARKLATHMQSHGFFDTRVTWTRQRFDALDGITFVIDPGTPREVREVEFVGNHAIDTTTLEGVVATKAARLSGALLGTNRAATSDQLAADRDRILEAYRRRGYQDVRVDYSASPEAGGLGSAALTAALVELGGGADLYVRFAIDEGTPTLLTTIEVDLASADSGPLCLQILHTLATELSEPQLAQRDPKYPGCLATAANVTYRAEDLTRAKDRLRESLFKQGRARSTVEMTAPETLGDRRVKVTYKVRRSDELTIGKVIIRGNFKTEAKVISDELAHSPDDKPFREGAKLTTDALADGARRLRTTGLFDAVNIDMPELASGGGSVVNAIIRVEERYDHTAQIEVEGGYSSLNGEFVTLRSIQRNLFKVGLSLVNSFTLGTKITDVESTIRIPRWLMRRWVGLNIQTDLNGRYLEQDTPRFGLLTTEGASLTFAYTPPSLQRLRTDAHVARSVGIGIHYDFRLRSRNVDALRPIGIDMDGNQVAISTRTGQVGVTAFWDQRVDRHGNPAPLSAEDGFRFEVSASYADRVLLGQNKFVKASAAASYFIPIGDNLVIRGDLRGDEGFPLDGALLPEVERFFAGGDSTVRGYNDDRMSTEVVQVPVPPLGNVSQIRVIPAGGNIRMLASVDAQLRIYSIFAAAVFGDAGMIANEWTAVTPDDIRPSVGTGFRFLTPFGIGALEYAVPLRVHLGDDPRGRLHFYFAARAQF